jgi:hypothetical protein
MSTTHQFHRRSFGIAALFAFTLLVPAAVTAEDDVAVMAPVAAPAVVGTSAEDTRAATRALAAERALLTGDIGSLQEDALFAVVAARTIAEPTRVLAAQQALLSPDLGSLQEEALTAIVAASRAQVEN